MPAARSAKINASVPEATATLVISGLPDGLAVEALCAAMMQPYEVSGAVHLSAEDVAAMNARAQRFSEASLPNALENDQGAERAPPHAPADMPSAEYKGEDYQLDQAVALLRAGKATPGATNMVQAAPTAPTP